MTATAQEKKAYIQLESNSNYASLSSAYLVQPLVYTNTSETSQLIQFVDKCTKNSNFNVDTIDQLFELIFKKNGDCTSNERDETVRFLSLFYKSNPSLFEDKAYSKLLHVIDMKRNNMWIIKSILQFGIRIQPQDFIKIKEKITSESYIKFLSDHVREVDTEALRKNSYIIDYWNVRTEAFLENGQGCNHDLFKQIKKQLLSEYTELNNLITEKKNDNFLLKVITKFYTNYFQLRMFGPLSNIKDLQTLNDDEKLKIKNCIGMPYDIAYPLLEYDIDRNYYNVSRNERFDCSSYIYLKTNDKQIIVEQEYRIRYGPVVQFLKNNNYNIIYKDNLLKTIFTWIPNVCGETKSSAIMILSQHKINTDKSDSYPHVSLNYDITGHIVENQVVTLDPFKKYVVTFYNFTNWSIYHTNIESTIEIEDIKEDKSKQTIYIDENLCGKVLDKIKQSLSFSYKIVKLNENYLNDLKSLQNSTDYYNSLMSIKNIIVCSENNTILYTNINKTINKIDPSFDDTTFLPSFLGTEKQVSDLSKLCGIKMIIKNRDGFELLCENNNNCYIETIIENDIVVKYTLYLGTYSISKTSNKFVDAKKTLYHDDIDRLCLTTELFINIEPTLLEIKLNELYNNIISSTIINSNNLVLILQKYESCWNSVKNNDKLFQQFNDILDYCYSYIKVDHYTLFDTKCGKAYTFNVREIREFLYKIYVRSCNRLLDHNKSFTILHEIPRYYKPLTCNAHNLAKILDLKVYNDPFCQDILYDKYYVDIGNMTPYLFKEKYCKLMTHTNGQQYYILTEKQKDDIKSQVRLENQSNIQSPIENNQKLVSIINLLISLFDKCDNKEFLKINIDMLYAFFGLKLEKELSHNSFIILKNSLELNKIYLDNNLPYEKIYESFFILLSNL